MPVNPHFRLVLLCAVFAGTLLSLTSCQSVHTESNLQEAGDPEKLAQILRDGVPPPSSIEEIVVDGRDLIVVGTVIGTVGTETIQVDTEEPGPTTPPDVVRDLKVAVELVLDDKLGKIGSPAYFVLRVPVNNSYPVDNEKYLFIASFGSGETGETFSSMFDSKDWIKADTTPVQYADGEYVPYASGMTYSEFIDALEVEIDSQ